MFRLCSKERKNSFALSIDLSIFDELTGFKKGLGFTERQELIDKYQSANHNLYKYKYK